MGAYLRVEESGARFVLGNDLVERAIVHERAGGGVHTSSLIYKPTGREWARAPSPEYELGYVMRLGRPPHRLSSLDPHDLVGWERREEAGGVVHLVLRLRSLMAGSARTPVFITLHYLCYPGHAVVRQWCEVENPSGRLFLTAAPMLSLRLRPPDPPLEARWGLRRYNYGPDTFTLHRLRLGPGVVGEVRSGHYWDSTWLGLADERDGDGLFVGWETNAPARCRFGDLEADGGLGIAGWLEPDYLLRRGRSFTSPPSFVGCFHGDADECSYRTHRFLEEHLAFPLPDERFPYVSFDTWGYLWDINEAMAYQLIDRVAALGGEVFVLDFGWADPDWRPLPAKFPHGLRPLSDYARSKGLKFGAHFAFGNVSSLSQVYREHPEWANGPGQWAYREAGQVFGLTLGNPVTRDWVVEKIVEVVDREGLDWLIYDELLYGPPNPAVQHLEATEEYTSLVEGLEAVLERVRTRRPHLLIEHCDGGGTMFTFRMVEQHVTAAGTDYFGAHAERIAAWRLTHAIPPRFIGKYLVDDTSDYAIRSCFFGGPLVLMNRLLEIEPGSPAWERLARNLALYQRLRAHLRDGKVLHLLEPRLEAEIGRGWDGWDAIGSYHPRRDQAVVFVFRAGGPLRERTIPLRGLRPEGRYRVRFQDRAESFVRGGAELLAEGIRLALEAPGEGTAGEGAPPASEIIYFEPAE